MSSNTRPASVRGLYTPPAEEWVFLPPSVNPPSSASPSPTPTHLPTPFTSSPSAMDDEENLALPALGRPLNLFLSEYLTTAMGMPFEVGKTLLQVEYRPRAQFAELENIPGIDVADEVEEKIFNVEDDELSNPEEADMYFSDRLAQSAVPLVPSPEPASAAAVDASGYLPDLHPTWLLKDDPEISRGNGVWGMIRRVRYTPSEGLPGLWKSQLVSTVHSFFCNILQPSVHSFLLVLIPGTSSPLNLDISLTALPNPALPLTMQVASHLLTHLILSPLEVIRTRLIVMPTSHPSTPSSVTLFRRMIDEEGGFSNLYFHPNLLIPSVLEHTIRPLLTLSIPLLVERQFGISQDINPVYYSLADLSLGLGSLLILLPIETVRRRLHLQHRSNSGSLSVTSNGGKKMKSIVKLRERDYVGVVEAIWRIISEETGVRRRRKMSKKDEGGWFAGVRQLYRGFGMAATAHVTVFGLGLVSATLAGNEGGWKEI